MASHSTAQILTTSIRHPPPLPLALLFHAHTRAFALASSSRAYGGDLRGQTVSGEGSDSPMQWTTRSFFGTRSMSTGGNQRARRSYGEAFSQVPSASTQPRPPPFTSRLFSTSANAYAPPTPSPIIRTSLQPTPISSPSTLDHLSSESIPVVRPTVTTPGNTVKGKGITTAEGLEIPDVGGGAKKGRTTGLKGKKAAISLTPQAITRLRHLLSSPTNPQLIRVSVRNRGCAGMAYDLSYVSQSEKVGRFDEVVEQEGVRVLVDGKALFSVIGSEMDWVEDRLSAKFVFNNPNVKDSCGCGESCGFISLCFAVPL